MIVYDKLWETMKEKKISKYHLIRYCNVSAGQLSRLKKNCFVSTHTINMLCALLECNVADIMEFIPDTVEETGLKESDPGTVVPKETCAGEADLQKMDAPSNSDFGKT